MLKLDLHIHTKGDPIDTFLKYTPMDMVKHAAKQKFDAIAITWHNKVFNTSALQSYAKKKGVTLIQGTEKTVEKKHILLYNVTEEEVSKIHKLEDLYNIKDSAMIGAPHPFFLIPTCLGEKLQQHKEVFDFVEHSHFYTKTINFNKKAHCVAQELKIPLVANSDAHHLSFFGKDYTMIEAENSAEAIIEAIKKQRSRKQTQRNNEQVHIYSRPYTAGEFLGICSMFIPKSLAYFTKQTISGMY